MAKMTVEFEHPFPEAKSHPNYHSLYETIVHHVDKVRRLEYVDEDDKQYAWEDAVTAIYGPEVWKAYNERAGWADHSGEES